MRAFLRTGFQDPIREHVGFLQRHAGVVEA